MADLQAHLEEGFGALVDELPLELGPDATAAWAIGYLYALAARSCPTAVRLIRDNAVGTLLEVDEAGDAKAGFAVLDRGGGLLLPVRVYRR